jgi:hypothetical protein
MDSLSSPKWKNQLHSALGKTWLTSWDMREQQNCIFASTYLTMTEMMTFTVNSRSRELWTSQNVQPLHGSLVYLLKRRGMSWLFLRHRKTNLFWSQSTTSFSIIGDTASSSFSLLSTIQWTNAECRLMRRWLLHKNVECKEDDGTWRVRSAAQNRECACGMGWEQDRNKIAHGAMGWIWELVWRPDWVKYWITYWILHTCATRSGQSSHCAGSTFSKWRLPQASH